MGELGGNHERATYLSKAMRSCGKSHIVGKPSLEARKASVKGSDDLTHCCETQSGVIILSVVYLSVLFAACSTK